MKPINENTKVTLTLGQLKRLVKETTEEPTEEDIFDYIKTMGSKVGGDDLIRDLQDTFGLSSTEAMTYVERYTHDDRRRFEHLDESTVPLSEDEGNDEEPVLQWEVVSKETGARFASGTIPENEKAEKFKSVLEFLYGDDVEVRIKRIF